MATPWEKVMEQSRQETERWKREELWARTTQQYALLAVSGRRYRIIKYHGVSHNGSDLVQSWAFDSEPLSYAEAHAEIRNRNPKLEKSNV